MENPEEVFKKNRHKLVENEDSRVEWKITKHQANQEKVRNFNKFFFRAPERSI